MEELIEYFTDCEGFGIYDLVPNDVVFLPVIECNHLVSYGGLNKLFSMHNERMKQLLLEVSGCLDGDV